MDLHETGKLPPLKFFHQVQQQGKLSHSLSYEEFARIWADIFWEQSAITQLATILHQNYTIGLLSNVGEIHWNWLANTFPIFRRFDKRILSFQFGHMKPAREIYQEAIHQSQSLPEQCAYIDDIEAYAKASRQLDIYGIHYQSPSQLYHELNQLHLTF